MFGPQAAAVLSPTIFVSSQVFDKETGKGGVKRRETTLVGSIGFTPAKSKKLSVALVLPATIAAGSPDGLSPMGNRWGWEDSLLTARYRVDTPGVTSALGLEKSYVMGVGGVELPTGTFDHPFGKSAYGQMAAGLISVEKAPVAMIAYGYYHHRDVRQGARDSGNMFTGGGFAYTPIDDEEHGRLFSLQLGLSYERTFAEELHGVPLLDSGSSGVFMHPGVVFAASPAVQIFTLVSIPVTQTWKSVEDRQQFRVGAGLIWILKHSGT